MEVNRTLDINDYDFIVNHIVRDGLPLVLSNATEGWDKELFSLDYLRDNFGDAELENSPRDNDSLKDLTGWTVRKYLES
jgi:hypothetical protein